MNTSSKRLSKRKCEMWISNNKVLVGGGGGNSSASAGSSAGAGAGAGPSAGGANYGKKPHARNPNFETEETRLLISLWGDPKVRRRMFDFIRAFICYLHDAKIYVCSR